MGGCMSAHEIGLIDALKKGNYNYLDRDKMEPRESLLASYDADVFLTSANAISNDGILVNIDGNSQSCILHCTGSQKGSLYCRNEQGL